LYEEGNIEKRRPAATCIHIRGWWVQFTHQPQNRLLQQDNHLIYSRPNNASCVLEKEYKNEEAS